jgi:two-component system, response regulator / RNA-binding antiterminator
VIDRAKGILMKAKNLGEEDAYALLRKTAMNENKKIADVAQSVITATELFK